MPEPSALHTDAILTNFSRQYQNEEYIWRSVMPVIPVNKRSDKYYTYNKADRYKLFDDQLGVKSMANEIDWGLSSDNYSVVDHGAADWLPQESIDNADDPLQPEIDTNDFLNNALDIKQEKRVADVAFAAASYPSSNKVTLSGTSQWGGSADDPIGDILTGIETSFQRANTLVFGQAAWEKLRQLPEILDAVKSSTRSQASPGGIATRSEVAALFDVDNILVGRARFTNDNGATYSRIWGKHCAALFVNPSPGVKAITWGGTFVETQRQTQRDFDPKRGIKGAHYFKVAFNSDEKVIASDVGYFIENAVA